jgi:acetylornithine deacetylase/succinyl-diaminopimelate desuccinylase-like protein
VQRIQNYQPQRDTSVVVFKHLSSMAIEDKATPENVDRIVEEVKTKNPQLSSTLRALSRMTVTPTIVSGGIKSNSVPEKCQLICDVRTLPHQDDSYVKKELEKLLQGVQGVDFEIDYMAVPNSSPYETDFARRIKEATRKSLGREDLNWIPSIATGFTDSRFLRPLGTTTYGFNGTHPEDDPMLARMHGTNESIGVKSLVSAAKITVALAVDMLAKR